MSFLEVSVSQVQDLPPRVIKLQGIRPFVTVTYGSVEMRTCEGKTESPTFTEAFKFPLPPVENRSSNADNITIRVMDNVGFGIKETLCELVLSVKECEEGSAGFTMRPMTVVKHGLIRNKVRKGPTEAPVANVSAFVRNVSWQQQTPKSAGLIPPPPPGLQQETSWDVIHEDEGKTTTPLQHVTTFREPKFLYVGVTVERVTNAIQRVVAKQGFTPFVEVSFLDGTKKQQTQYGANNPNPVFGHDMVFCLPQNIKNKDMRIVLKDYVKYGVDETLAEATIPWQDIESGKLVKGDTMITLQPRDHGAVRNAFMASGQPCTVHLSSQVLSHKQQSIASSHGDDDTSSILGYAQLTIRRVHGLRHYSKGARKFNPYCVVQCEDRWQVLPVFQNCDEPNWESSVVEFPVRDFDSMIVLCIFHSREIAVREDKLIGRVAIRLSTLAYRGLQNVKDYPMYVMHTTSNKVRKMGCLDFQVGFDVKTPLLDIVDVCTRKKEDRVVGKYNYQVMSAAHHEAVKEYFTGTLLKPEVFSYFNVEFTDVSSYAFKEYVGRIKKMATVDLGDVHHKIVSWENPGVSVAVNIGWVVVVYAPSIVLIGAVIGLLGITLF
eukprot:PhF_6_TR10370/c0_g1_i3/m.16130